MKRLTLVLLTIGFLQIARAQFEGVLYYDCTIKNKTLTTIYASKTKVLLESKTYPMKEGAADIGAGLRPSAASSPTRAKIAPYCSSVI